MDVWGIKIKYDLSDMIWWALIKVHLKEVPTVKLFIEYTCCKNSSDNIA